MRPASTCQHNLAGWQHVKLRGPGKFQICGGPWKFRDATAATRVTLARLKLEESELVVGVLESPRSPNFQVSG